MTHNNRTAWDTTSRMDNPKITKMQLNFLSKLFLTSGHSNANRIEAFRFFLCIPMRWGLYLVGFMEESRSHIFASWFSRSIRNISPEISTTVPTPLGICTLSCSLGLHPSVRLLVVGGKALTSLTFFRKELGRSLEVFGIFSAPRIFADKFGSNHSLV